MKENAINTPDLQKFIEGDYFWFGGHLSVTIEYKRMPHFIRDVMKCELEELRDVDVEESSLTINLFDRVLERHNINPREVFPVNN